VSSWGRKRERGRIKQSCASGSQNSAVLFGLLAGVQVKKEAGREAVFVNFIVASQE